MASLPEINSFISKFVNLWKSGCKASLHLEARAGKAQINLQMGLGQVPPLPQTLVHRVPGPARQIRHQRVRDVLKQLMKLQLLLRTMLHKHIKKQKRTEMILNKLLKLQH